MTWTSIFIAGLITYFTRMGMVTLIDKDIFSENFRKILNYVPSVVFPSIIFPGVLLDDYGTLVVITDPKIYGGISHKKCYIYHCIRFGIILVTNICFLTKIK